MFDLIKLKKDFRKIQKNKMGKRIVYPHVRIKYDMIIFNDIAMCLFNFIRIYLEYDKIKKYNNMIYGIVQ